MKYEDWMRNIRKDAVVEKSMYKPGPVLKNEKKIKRIFRLSRIWDKMNKLENMEKDFIQTNKWEKKNTVRILDFIALLKLKKKCTISKVLIHFKLGSVSEEFQL